MNHDGDGEPIVVPPKKNFGRIIILRANYLGEYLVLSLNSLWICLKHIQNCIHSERHIENNDHS